MTRLFLLPGQNYTGPFNPVDRAYRRRHPPRDKLDAASLAHDLGYAKLQRAGVNPYTQFNAADARYLERIRDLPGWRAGLARGVFKAKQLIMSSRRSVYRKLFLPKTPSRATPSSRSASTPLAVARARARRHAVPTGTTFSAYSTGGRPSRPVVSAAAKYGSRGMCQFDGDKTMDHVNYLGISSLGPRSTTDGLVGGNVMYHVSAAFLRKALRRHYKIEVTNPLETPFNNGGAPVNPISGGAYLPHAMEFYYRNRQYTGSESKGVGYTLYFTDALTFAGAAKLIATNVFDSANFGQEDNNGSGATTTLYGYQFLSRDATALALGVVSEAAIRPEGVVPCWNWRMSCTTVAQIAIQNVTVADGGSTDAHSIDRNPLRGKSFMFTTPFPHLADDRGVRNTAPANGGYALQVDLNADGIVFVNSAGGLGGLWNQLPSATMFKHCKSVAGIHMAPGAILRNRLVFKFSGTIENFMKGTTVQQTVSNVAQRNNGRYMFGKSLLFALEKVMSTGNDAVKINYEVSYHSSAVIGRGPVSTIDPLQQSGNAVGVDRTIA